MKRGDVLVDRCPSGVPGFDNIAEGGFVRGSLNSILGDAGAGKTIFLLSFLYHGAVEHKENGIYVSFEPDVVDLYKDAQRFGWDFQKLDSLGKVKFFKISPHTQAAEIKRELTKLIAKYDIKRVCFDPIGLFQAGEENGAKIRMEIFDLMSLLKRLNVTVLLADENPNIGENSGGMASADQKSQYTRFLADGLVDIFSSGLGGVGDRAVRITKMRRTSHSRGPVPMKISDDGMEVLSKQKKGLGL